MIDFEIEKLPVIAKAKDEEVEIFYGQVLFDCEVSRGIGKLTFGLINPE